MPITTYRHPAQKPAPVRVANRTRYVALFSRVHVHHRVSYDPDTLAPRNFGRLGSDPLGALNPQHSPSFEADVRSLIRSYLWM